MEQKLLLRLQKKATAYAQEFAADGGEVAKKETNGRANASAKIDVDGVVDLYESYIIPLTKEVEVIGVLSLIFGLH